MKSDQTSTHAVHFYEDDESLVDRVCAFVATGLETGDGAIIIATAAHLDAFGLRLRQRLGVSIGIGDDAAARNHPHLLLLDAEAMLACFMVDGWPDERRFSQAVEPCLARAGAGTGRHLHIFGEMVAVLCAQGNPEAAIHLEGMWNSLLRQHSFTLLCGYPMHAFSTEKDQQHFDAICTLHSSVCPSHSCGPEAHDDIDRINAKLHQRTLALESRVREHDKTEEILRMREEILLERTASLIDANERLKAEIEKRKSAEQNLLHVQRVLTSAQKLAGLGSWEINASSGRLHCSDEFFDICGRMPQSAPLTLKFVLRIVHPDDRKSVKAFISDIVGSARQHAGNAVTQEYSTVTRVIRPDRTVRHVVSHGQPIFDERQQLVAVIGSFLDITEARLAEQTLRTSEERFRSLANLSSDWYWEQDADFRFVELTKASFHDKLKIRADHLIGRTRKEIGAVQTGDSDWAVLDAYLAARRPFRDFEYTMLDVDNTRKYVQISGEPVFDADGNFTGYRGVGKDITERKNAEQALRQSHEDLRRLAAHQEMIKEEERKRIAREIHDELGGLLTGMKALITVSMEQNSTPDAGAKKLLAEAADLIDVAIDSVRRIVTDLRPSVLDQLGVLAAIEWYAEQIAERTPLQCEYAVVCKCALQHDASAIAIDAERSTMLFRIVQEALTNIVRHAQASVVRIRIMCRERSIAVEIADDGKGIATDDMLHRESWGIQGMYERVRHFKGDLQIKGIPGQGTTIVLLLPLENTHDR
jgi:PAS domain S-box-containing protein